MSSVALRQKVERAVVIALIEHCAKAGYVPVAVWDGDEYCYDAGQSSSYKRAKLQVEPMNTDEVLSLVFGVDECTLHFGPAADRSAWGNQGVMLVFGNSGWDLISDYHSHASGSKHAAFTKAVDEVSERCADEGNFDVVLRMEVQS